MWFAYRITEKQKAGKARNIKEKQLKNSRSTEIKLALKVNDKDNVATIFANGITDGTEVEIRDKKGNAETVTVIGDVPYGHKIAVRDIKKGELINKYGEEIGIATKDIKKGEYVHVHNLDSMRGRGDWAKEGK